MQKKYHVIHQQACDLLTKGGSMPDCVDTGRWQTCWREGPTLIATDLVAQTEFTCRTDNLLPETEVVQQDLVGNGSVDFQRTFAPVRWIAAQHRIFAEELPYGDRTVPHLWL